MEAGEAATVARIALRDAGRSTPMPVTRPEHFFIERRAERAARIAKGDADYLLHSTAQRGGTGRHDARAAGCGVVADSAAEAEWEETRQKSRALFRAAEEAARFAGGGEWGGG